MQGLVYTEVGTPDTLKLMEVPRPTASQGQALIEVRASSMNYSDYARFEKALLDGKISSSDRFKERFIKKAIGEVIGSEVAGVVVEVASDVTTVRPGDEVYAVTPGLKGAWAEYAAVNVTHLARKPGNLTFEQAATVPTSGTTALAAIRASRVEAGAHALVYGASGGVGQFVVQLLKSAGVEVTAVCSTRNVEAAARLGADHVIDYQTDDFTQNTDAYDAIIAVNGYHPLRTYKPLLKRGGVYVAIGGAKQGMAGLLLGPFASIGAGKRFTSATYLSEIKKNSLARLSETIERDDLTPYVEDTISLAEVPATITRLLTEHSRGKTAIRMKPQA